MQRTGPEQWSTRDVARMLSLVESERRYFQEIVAGLPVSVAVIAPDLTFSSANRAFRTLFNLALNGPLDAPFDQIVPIPEITRSIAAVVTSNQPATELLPKVATASGQRPMRVTVQPLPHWEDPSSVELVIVFEDVSNPATETLVSTGEVVHVPALFWIVDVPSMRFHSVTGPGLSSLPVPRDLWKPDAEFWSARVAASDIADLRSFYQVALTGGVIRSCDYRATSSASECLWLRDIIGIERDADGRPVRIHGLTLDVTPTRRREDSATQAIKIASLSRLASLIAHDCNNLLMIMSGYSEELTETLDPDHPLRGNIQEILYAGGRLSALTRQLTEFVRYPTTEVRPIAVDAFLADLHWHLRQEIPHPIELVMSLKAAGATCQADPNVLTQIVQTLAQRARESMPTGGTLTIETVPYDWADAITGNRSPLPPGPYVQLTIRDTGTPIPANSFMRLFEPNVNGDSGRHNFASLYNAIRLMGGDLSVSSDSERGTAFRILLFRGAFTELNTTTPVAEEVIPKPPAPQCVLVVEDERRIRALIAKILTRYGFRILEAAEGKEAVELVRSYSGPIDLLLTDVVMPNMGGIELADNLRSLRPDLKVLFISGYPGVPGLPSSHLPPGSSFLQKPFTLQSLVAKVREAIGAPRSASAAAD